MQNNKKITIFMSSFRAGGGERNMVNLANGLVERGFDVDLLVIYPVGPYIEQLDSRINIHSVESKRTLFSLPKVILYFKHFNPEVILATDEFTHIISIISKKITFSNTRVVLRVGNMFSVLFKQYNTFKQKITIFFAKLLYKYADIYIANSLGVADDFSEVFGIDKDKINVINNPKDIDYIRSRSKEEVKHKWLKHKEKPVVLAVSRLRYQKDIPSIIKAFNMVNKEIPSKLIVVGGGRDKNSIEKLIESMNLGNSVDLLGFSDNPYALMSKSDVFITASLWEGLPNSLQEAMVCGMPVIATDCSSGPREIISPKTDPLFRLKEGVEHAEYGLLVPVSDINSLYEAMKEMLLDSNIRSKYSKKSIERSVDFDSNFILDKYIKALEIK